MSGSNALAVSQKSVIAEIIERLAALTPEQFIEPDTHPDANYRAVGEASDDIKRLFTLRNITCDEHNVLGKDLSASMEELKKNLRKANANRSKLEALQAIVSLQEAPETLRIIAEMNRKRSFHSIIEKICWLELRRQYPELADRPNISIRKNWTVGWCERDDTEALSDIFGDDDQLGVPSEFLEFLSFKTR